MVVRVDDPATAADPVKLLDVLKRVERDLGRAEGGRRFGPRPIDLDIIFHERGVHRCARLEVPHPRYAERGFVLAPLADLHTGAGIAGGDSFNVAAGLTTALKLWRQSGGEARVAPARAEAEAAAAATKTRRSPSTPSAASSRSGTRCGAGATGR